MSRGLLAVAVFSVPVAAAACDGLVGLAAPSYDSPDATAGDDAGTTAVFPPPLTCDRDASGTYDGGVARFLGDVPGFLCQRMIRCGMIDTTQLADCVTTVTYENRYRAATVLPAAEAGTVTLDPCFASACLAAIGAAGCDPTSSVLIAGDTPDADSFSWVDSLDTLIQGGGSSGQRNLLSLMSTYNGGACGRAFVGHLPPGAPADDPTLCGAGTMFVPPDPMSPPGTPGTCEAPVAIGDACDSGTACPTACASPLGGDAGFFLVASMFCGAKDMLQCFCAPLLGEGEPCSPAVSLSGGCSDCVSPCVSGLICDPTDNVCRPLGSHDAGATCTPGFDEGCAPGLYCDPSAMQCAPRLPAGTPCSAEFACQDGLWCVGYTAGANGVCQVPVFNGPCDDSKLKSSPLPGTDGCLALGQQCVQGTCASLPSGGPCEQVGTCSSLPPAECVFPAPPNYPYPVGTCVREGATGSSCSSAVDCMSGECQGGLCTGDAGLGDAQLVGTVSGTVSPSNATVEIDGTLSDPPSPLPQAPADIGDTFFAPVPIGSPFQIVARASGYWPMTLQEMIATGPNALLPQQVTLVTSAYATSLTNAAPGYDSSLGVLGLSVLSLGQCASVAGATLAVTGPDAGSAQVIYLASNGTPSSATSVTSSSFPSAFAYNVPVGVDLSVTVSHPTCAPAPYPVAVPTNVTLTGRVRVSAGTAASYALVYLQ